MTDKQKEPHKDFSTCFEGMPFAEMMGKMMAGHGSGAICAEMMQKIIDQQQTGSHFDCAEMMEKMMTMCSRPQTEEEKASKD